MECGSEKFPYLPPPSREALEARLCSLQCDACQFWALQRAELCRRDHARIFRGASYDVPGVKRAGLLVTVVTPAWKRASAGPTPRGSYSLKGRF